MEFKIRKANRTDLQAVLDLVLELAVFEKEPEAVKANIDDYYKAYDDDLIDINVAEANNTIVGMTISYMTFSTWKGHMYYLEDFYVKPAFRSHGVGQTLFDTFISDAKSNNCTMVKWQVLDWNEGAIKFYKRNNATIEVNWWNGKIIF